MTDLPKLIRWQTPISDDPFPSIVSVVKTDVLRIVAATRTDKFEFEFPVFMAFRCTDESIPWQWPNSEVGTTAIFEGSPWLESYPHDRQLMEIYYGGPCRHFVILGGDWNVEILAAHAPSVKKIV
jgi:hypothetical protein